jgi:hypothetical protein
MRIIQIGSALILFIVSVLGPAVSARADCVAAGAQGQKEIVNNYAAGVDLVSATSYVPAGALSEFGLRTPYDPKILYSGKIESDFDALNVGKAFSPIEKHSLNISRIPDDHPLVKRGRMDKNDTLVTIEIPSSISGLLWEQARIYIYACPTIDGGSPTAVSSTVVRVSPTFPSIVIAVLFVLLAYVLCALTAKAIDRSNVLNYRWMRYLDPVYMTAGSDGKGSLSKLQILFFSTIVFGLLTYIWLRTGVLSDLSKTVLTLLGIAAVGSTTAKATDIQKNRIESNNLTWFFRKHWLPATGLAAVNEAKWRDIVSSDGEFDVYRYQNCIFSAVVGLSLLFAGVTELSSFSIPDTLLGVLGLSQVVYVAGKLVTPPSFSDLNDSADALRILERQFFDAATTTPDPNPPPNTSPTDAPQTLQDAIRRAGTAKYNAFKIAVENFAIEFTSVVGKAPIQGADMEPSFRV